MQDTLVQFIAQHAYRLQADLEMLAHPFLIKRIGHARQFDFAM